MKYKYSGYLLSLAFLLSFPIRATTINYPTGVFREYILDYASEREYSLNKFLAEHFVDWPVNHQWIPEKSIKDSTHEHRLYGLYIDGRKVADHFLKVSIKPNGVVEFARSNLQEPRLNVIYPTKLKNLKIIAEENLAQWKRQHREYHPNQSLTKIYWWNQSRMQMIPAIELKLNTDDPLIGEWKIIDESTGELLRVNRLYDTFQSGIFPTHPNSSSLTRVEVQDTTTAGQLSNQFFLTCRGISSTSCVTFDPRVDYSSSISLDPNNYNSDCGSNSAACPNQSFDGVNAWYHLNKYRGYVVQLLSELGADSSAISDQLLVFINYTGTIGNLHYGNAAFATSSGYKYLLFQPPGLEGCYTNTGPVMQNDSARDAVVFLHEIQHYFTYGIAGIRGNHDNEVALKGVLNEGYSDYMALSFLSAQTGKDLTIFGEYIFQNCPNHQRNIGNLLPFENTSAFAEEHDASPIWSSGLWELRKRFGTSVADKLAFKTLILLSPAPTFSETVESLVRADRLVFDGSHSGDIREIFYDKLKYYGGDRLAFEKGEKPVLNLGFASCVGVHSPQANSLFSIFQFALLLVPVLIARRLKFIY